MKKINILYDATMLTQGFLNGPARAGLFFTAYNLLKQFAADFRFHVILYLSEMSDYRHFMEYMKNDGFFSQFSVIANYKQPNVYKYNIGVHKKNISLTNNIFKKIYYYLKIIKNYLYQFLFYKNADSNYETIKTIDAYFSPLNAVPPEIAEIGNIKQFLVLHDVIPNIYPEYYHDLSSDHWYIKMINSLNKKHYCFCNSESTRNDFLSYFGRQLDERKLFVTHISSSQQLRPDYDDVKLTRTLKKYNVMYDSKKKYIFSFCTLEPRKNLIFTIRCFFKFIERHNIDDLYFFLGGGHWDRFIGQLKEQINNFNIYSKKIVQLGYIDDEDVNVLYSNSLFFAYISQYEGFGMPPLEAMQAGTPVITSNNSSLPEVVGDAAITITYNDEEACIKAFEDFYFNEALRKEYIAKGLERAKLFSWEKTYIKISDIIINVI